MFPEPLHPAVVHLPLGIAVVFPLIAATLAFFIFKGRWAASTWWLAVVLQATVAIGAVVAVRSGEQIEDRVEDSLTGAGQEELHEHEELGEAFQYAALALLLLVIAGAFVRGTPGNIVRAASAAGALGLLGLGVEVGEHGGAVVYEHNGAAVFSQPATPGGAGSGHEDDEEDEH